jgi:hypothetical protein
MRLTINWFLRIRATADVRGKWDAAAVARQHYHLLANAPRHELISALAETYGADLAAKLEPDVKGHPEEGWPQSLVTAIFAGFDEKRQRVVIEVNIHQLQRDGAGRAVGYSTKRFPASDAAFAQAEQPRRRALLDRRSGPRETKIPPW